MRGRCKVRIGHPVARQPVAAPDKVADVAQMIAQIGARGAYGLHVRAASPLGDVHKALIDLLSHKPLTCLVKKLDVKPMHEPARFRPGQWILGHQTAIAESQASGLIQIFGDHLRSR